MMRELLKELRARRDEAGLQRGELWSVVFDNASIHAEFAELCAGQVVVHPIAPHSPDFNKPIEHVWGQMEASKAAWIEQQRGQQAPAAITPAAFREAVRGFFNNITRESIAADVASLPDTYAAVQAAAGGYPPAALM